MKPPTIAATRLDHIRANLEAIRVRVGDRKVLAAVKADAYGHGAVPVARMLEGSGAADWLGVANVGEGVELRVAGIRMPILKLSVARGDEVAVAVASDIALCVVDSESIAEAAVASARSQVRAAGALPNPAASFMVGWTSQCDQIGCDHPTFVAGLGDQGAIAALVTGQRGLSIDVADQALRGA